MLANLGDDPVALSVEGGFSAQNFPRAPPPPDRPPPNPIPIACTIRGVPNKITAGIPSPGTARDSTYPLRAPGAEGPWSAREAATLANTTWSPAARANDGRVAPTGGKPGIH